MGNGKTYKQALNPLRLLEPVVQLIPAASEAIICRKGFTGRTHKKPIARPRNTQ